MTKVAVVIPVFNQVHLTRRCLPSLIAGASEPQELIIIDNHSTDDTPQYLAEVKAAAESKGWKVAIVTNSENLGVAKAWNQGIQKSTAPYVAIANNDTWIMPGWDNACVRRIQELHASMVGAFFDETPFDENETPKKAAEFVIRNANKKTVHWSSIFMFFDRTAFDRVGLFDERYFVTYEDRDMRERMDRAGLTYFMIADCFVWHHSKGTRDSGKIRPRYEEESLEEFISKWGFDPRPAENKFLYRYRRKWRNFKNRFGYF